MELFREALAADEPLALATVVATAGSTPRHPGAHMLIDRDGRGRGTIGGGRVELEVCHAAAEVAAGAAPRRVEHHLVRDLAMCCGGSMTLYLEPVEPSRPALTSALALRARRGAGALVHHLDGRPMAVVEGVAPPRAALDGDRFVEPIRPGDRAILFGGGHVARALGPILAQLDFEVVVCDDGDTGALEPPPAFAQRVIESFDLTDVERELGRLGPGDHVIILTRDHAVDQKVLEACLPRAELAYLGLIGSRGKLGRFRKRIEQKELASEADWARLHAPIGLDLGAETPAEIAVAVAAELVARRRGRSGARG